MQSIIDNINNIEYQYFENEKKIVKDKIKKKEEVLYLNIIGITGKKKFIYQIIEELKNENFLIENDIDFFDYFEKLLYIDKDIEWNKKLKEIVNNENFKNSFLKTILFEPPKFKSVIKIAVCICNNEFSIENIVKLLNNYNSSTLNDYKNIFKSLTNDEILSILIIDEMETNHSVADFLNILKIKNIKSEPQLLIKNLEKKKIVKRIFLNNYIFDNMEIKLTMFINNNILIEILKTRGVNKK
ncbi:hypothetical protein ACTFIR_009715 [Dictyostelium discoideum]